MATIKILEYPFNRSYLEEGRDYGLGFSLVKKITSTKYKPLIPLTACKDYLNDICHSEEYNSVHGLIYGFNYEHSNYFEKDKKHGYMLLKDVPYIEGEECEYEEEINSALMNNYKNLLRVLHYFEDRLEIKRTEYQTTTDPNGDKVVFLKFDRFWMKETFLMSLYTILIRYYMNYTLSSVSKQKLIDHRPIISSDKYIFSSSIKELYIKNFKKLKYFKNNSHIYTKQASNISFIHNYGIVESGSNLFNNNKFIAK